MSMIVLKHTPKSHKLIPLSEIRGMTGKKMLNSDPQAAITSYVMSALFETLKALGNYRRFTLKELFDATQARTTLSSNIKYLSATGETPERILIV